MTTAINIDHTTKRATRASIIKVAARCDFVGQILFGNRVRQTSRPDSDADITAGVGG